MSSRRPAEDPAGGQPDTKRPRTDGLPAPPGGGTFDIATIRARIAQQKAEAEARLAAQASKAAAASTSNVPAKPPSTASSAPGPAALPPRPTADASIAERVAAAKARIEAINSKMANPYLSGSGGIPKNDPSSSSSSSSITSKPTPTALPISGLSSSVALHPLLMGDAALSQNQERNEKKALRDRYKTMAPKFSTVKANAAVAAAATPPAVVVAPTPVLNPYTSAPATTAAPGNRIASPAVDEAGTGNGGRGARPSKKMHFSAPGKYVQQGDVLRNEAKMEALRQRIAEASKRAGLDSEFDTLERSLKRQPPPEVEWWDKALLPDGHTYQDIESSLQQITTSEDSLITHLVQHPIPIPAPGDRKQAERGLMLTKKEQKKMRRQRRKAELEDKRDRQKMGLIPPDPPKVRMANLMKVLTSDAVQDPTKVEAKVKREVAQRASKHEQDNKERQLTVEQRKEKEYQQMLARERKGIYGAVFKVKYLSNGRHRYKVRETAKKDALSGICVFNPNFALVLVEGVDKSIKHYTNLMLRRIDWTEEARPLGEEGDEDKEDEDEGPSAVGGGNKKEEKPESLEDNKCEMIWTGELPERSFKAFRARHAETDSKAKEWLTPKWEGMWDLAKRWVWQGEDL